MLREGNVFSSCLSVSLSVCRKVPKWPLPMMHWISQYRDPLALSPSVQGSNHPCSPPNCTESTLVPQLVKSGGQDWKPVQFVHFRIPTSGGGIWWLMVFNSWVFYLVNEWGLYFHKFHSCLRQTSTVHGGSFHGVVGLPDKFQHARLLHFRWWFWKYIWTIFIV